MSVYDHEILSGVSQNKRYSNTEKSRTFTLYHIKRGEWVTISAVTVI